MADETPDTTETPDIDAAYEAAITTFGSIAHAPGMIPQQAPVVQNAPAAQPTLNQPQVQNTNQVEPDDITDDELSLLEDELGTKAAGVLRKLVAKASGAATQVKQYRSIMDELAPIREVVPQVRALGARARDEESQKMHAALDRIAKMGGEAIVGRDRNDRVARFEDLRPGMAKIVSAAESVHKAIGGDTSGKSVWDIVADLWERQNPVAAQAAAREQSNNRQTFADTASRAAARAQPTRHSSGPSGGRAGQKPAGAMALIDSYLKGR